MPKAYSTFQAAKILGVSPPTVIKWTNDGKLKSYRTPGGHRRILDSVLKDFLASYHSDNKKFDMPSKVVLFIQRSGVIYLVVIVLLNFVLKQSQALSFL